MTPLQDDTAVHPFLNALACDSNWLHILEVGESDGVWLSQLTLYWTKNFAGQRRASVTLLSDREADQRAWRRLLALPAVVHVIRGNSHDGVGVEAASLPRQDVVIVRAKGQVMAETVSRLRHLCDGRTLLLAECHGSEYFGSYLLFDPGAELVGRDGKFVRLTTCRRMPTPGVPG